MKHDSPTFGGTIVYLNGTSSSGKTTLANSLHEILPGSWLNVQADSFFNLLTRPDPWTIQPVLSAIHALAVTAARGGVGVIVDGLLATRTWLKDAADRLADQRAFLVAVRCPLDELERREAARKDRRVGNAREQYEFVHAPGVYDFEVDTSLGEPTECGAQIAAWLARGPEPFAFRTLTTSAYLCDEEAYGWVLTRGSFGPAVRRLQDDLGLLGYAPGPTDGVFGQRTEAALQAFQRAHGLPPDGAMGWPRTVKAIIDALDRRTASAFGE
jgi:chloramphenicol 3-O phosphotransferase